MEDIWYADHLCGFDDCAAEQPETLGVVWVVAGGRGVEALAVKQFRTIDKVCLDSFHHAAVKDADEAVVRRERNGHALKNDRRIQHRLGDLPIVRNKYADLV